MDDALRIAALIALILFIILSFYAIISLSSVNKLVKEAANSLKNISFDIKDLKQQVTRVLTDVSDLKVRIYRTLDEFSEIKAKAVVSFDNIDEAVTEIKLISRSIEHQADAVFQLMKPLSDISSYFYGKIAKPLTNVVSISSAAFKAFKVFKNVISHKDKQAG